MVRSSITVCPDWASALYQPFHIVTAFKAIVQSSVAAEIRVVDEDLNL
jgi:hypothetical protein